MASRRGIAALLRVLQAEIAEAVENGPEMNLRRLDASIRNAEGDLERVRQELDELLRGDASDASDATQRELPL